ncbi:MAG: PilZ domain-containing protein [Myxococcales bacterium]|nr:PilZ domain-containing protein [Myxococcales bacterium]
MTRVILAKLGFVIVTQEEFASLGPEIVRRGPEIRIVDERNLADIPEEKGAPVPILVLTGRHGVTGADPRIVGAVRRPAGMHELYRLIQQVLEETPRTTPRVPTHIVARCRRRGVEWKVAILSLSENGCLLRSPEPLLLGTRIELRFALPHSGPLELMAETAYQLVPDTGVIFHATSPDDRAAIGLFVKEALIAL